MSRYIRCLFFHRWREWSPSYREKSGERVNFGSIIWSLKKCRECLRCGKKEVKLVNPKYR